MLKKNYFYYLKSRINYLKILIKNIYNFFYYIWLKNE